MDVYLIAGQSNAGGNTYLANVGDGTNDWDALTEWNGSSRVNGFENVWYSGTYGTDSVLIAQAKANVHNNGMMGLEVGIAEVLSSHYTGETVWEARRKLI